MAEPYTAEDFAGQIERHKLLLPNPDRTEGISLAAFEIALAVVTPGVLGEVVMKVLGPSARPSYVEETVNAIRKALTAPADTRSRPGSAAR